VQQKSPETFKKSPEIFKKSPIKGGGGGGGGEGGGEASIAISHRALYQGSFGCCRALK